MTEEQVAAVVQQYQFSGKSQRTLAQEFAVSVGTINDIIQQHNNKFFSPTAKQLSMPLVRVIRAAVEGGLDTDVICQALRIDTHQVKRALHEQRPEDTAHLRVIAEAIVVLDKGIMTAEEIAKELGVSKSTLYRWISSYKAANDLV